MLDQYLDRRLYFPVLIEKTVIIVLLTHGVHLLSAAGLFK